MVVVEDVESVGLCVADACDVEDVEETMAAVVAAAVVVVVAEVEVAENVVGELDGVVAVVKGSSVVVCAKVVVVSAMVVVVVSAMAVVEEASIVVVVSIAVVEDPVSVVVEKLFEGEIDACVDIGRTDTTFGVTFRDAGVDPVRRGEMGVDRLGGTRVLLRGPWGVGERRVPGDVRRVDSVSFEVVGVRRVDTGAGLFARE